jgi:lactate dehydrogenase-like 2-hydroxyacid dehydrogenase
VTIEVLQLCPVPTLLQKGLEERFKVYRWFEIDDKAAWLKTHAQSIRAVVTGGHVGIESALVEQLPTLGIIAISGVGHDRVSREYARARGIRITYTPDVLTDDVADLTLGLIISLLRELPAAHEFVKSGQWTSGKFPLGRKLSGRRFGIVGLGRIGSAIAARLAVMGPVAYTATSQKQVPYTYFASVIELARASDILVLSAAVTPGTRGLVTRAVLDALGPQGYLVNVARGAVVDDVELIAALTEKRIAGAALDVFTDEPNVPQALLALPNVMLTPHIGSATHETREGMGRAVLASLDAFFAGQPVPNALE